MSSKTPTSEDRPASRGREGGPAARVGWFVAGALFTLGVVLLLRWTAPALVEPTPSSPPAATATSDRARPGRAAAAATGEGPSPREQFAMLYSSYLLNTYYVARRGFCQPLLRRVCLALHHAELLANARDCDAVPNDELVLAIGRYQHRVGLPVDGKAGPETVRMMLGGDFSNRRGMEEAYCTGGSQLEEDAASPAADDAPR